MSKRSRTSETPSGLDDASRRAETSFDVLYRNHRARVRAIVGAILGDPCDAEEATHDVLLKGHTALESGRVALHALPRWLRTTARRHALDLRKSRTRALARDDRYAVTHQQAPCPGPEGPLDARHITDFLRRQHPQDLKLVERCLVLDSDRASVARELGITENTLGVRLHRAVARLRTAMRDRSGDSSTDRR